MSLEQRAKLTISAAAAYGEKGCVDRANAHGTGRIPPNADLVFDVELLDINGRRSLARYLSTLDEWIHQKLNKHDHDEAAKAAAAEKHGGREGYEMHLREVALKKYESERLKKGPRAPTIEEVTEALVAATAALSTGDDAAVGPEAMATVAAAVDVT